MCWRLVSVGLKAALGLDAFGYYLVGIKLMSVVLSPSSSQLLVCPRRGVTSSEVHSQGYKTTTISLAVLSVHQTAP